MNNFASNVDRGAKGFKRYIDDIDGADDAGAKAARLEQKNLLLRRRAVALCTIGDGVERRCSHLIIITIQRISEGRESKA